jgi:3-oxocholest-4-en-26-oate---CoA ligase
MNFQIADLFESLADTIPERTALVADARRLTFAELDARANQLANALKARGIGHGDHVGLHLYNGSEFLEAMLAAFKLRAVPININYRYVAAELRALFDNANLTALLSQRELAAEVGPAVVGLDRLHTVILVDDGSGGTVAGRDLDYEQTLATAPAHRDFGPRSADDLFIIYTGGTTGRPRGVMWRHEDVFYAGLQGGAPGGTPIERPEELAERARDPDNAMCILPAAPFIHGAAQWGALIALFTGGKAVVQPGRSFDARGICELIEREHVGTITLVGDAMAQRLADALAGPGAPYRCDSLLVIASAGAVLSPSVRERLQGLLPNTLVLNNFGASETGHQGSAYPGAEVGTGGRPSFAMDDSNTVLDADLRPVRPGSGVIGKLARSGRVPLGYYNDPVMTAERFKLIDGVRWVLPGDDATVEADGRITVFGRGANCINTGGEKVFPEEVEEVLKGHPSVFDALVVGVPDPTWMQRVAAVVQLRDGHRSDAVELQAHCRGHLAGYKVPRQLYLVDQIVRQPSGKPDYTWASQVARSSPGEAPGLS